MKQHPPLIPPGGFSAGNLSTTRKLAQIQKNIRELEGTCLELLSHPDATPEQLMEAQTCLVVINKKYREVVHKMIEKGYRHGR